MKERGSNTSKLYLKVVQAPDILTFHLAIVFFLNLSTTVWQLPHRKYVHSYLSDKLI